MLITLHRNILISTLTYYKCLGKNTGSSHKCKFTVYWKKRKNKQDRCSHAVNQIAKFRVNILIDENLTEFGLTKIYVNHRFMILSHFTKCPNCSGNVVVLYHYFEINIQYALLFSTKHNIRVFEVKLICWVLKQVNYLQYVN